jgi:predicted nucleic acid-binding protein
MAARSRSKGPSAATSNSGRGLYIDSSALAKLYVSEPESEVLDEFLQTRQDLMISELVVTEVISAVARRRREGALNAKQANEIRKAVLSDTESGAFRLLDLNPAVHREAERMLLSTDSVALRTLDALHIALARQAEAAEIITFDARMADAAVLYGLGVTQLPSREHL